MHHSRINRRQSRRLNGYDYASEGLYFITIKTKDRNHLFGEIHNGKMHLNEAGFVAENCWLAIPDHFPHTAIHEYVIMPDHIHGIVEIVYNPNTVGAKIRNSAGAHEPVGARLIAPLHKNGGFAGNHNPMFHQNLSRIIRWYKGRCTFEIRKTDASFEWQRNYHEHLIRNTEAYERISLYIQDNPKNYNPQGCD